MKKILVWILVLALLAVASVLGTIAYLMDEAKADNVMTVGNVKISLLEFERTDVETPNDTNSAVVQEFSNNEKPLLPAVIAKDFDYTVGDTYVDWEQIGKDGYQSDIWDPAKINNEVDKMVFVKNTGDYSAYVRIYFAFEAGAFTNFDDFREMIHLNLNETDAWEWEWTDIWATNNEGGTYFIAKATYQNELLPGDFTDITLSQIALDSSATNEQVAAFGDTYEVFVNAQGIQSTGFKDPDTALDEGFGDDIPFTNLKFVTPVDLKTALHYLNGDKTSDVLVGTSDVGNGKVSSVTFGLAKDHYADVSGYNGVLTTNGSEENKFTAYTYYIQNADGKYDIYVLSDKGEIYAPKDCESLFLSMSSLSMVDTSNFNVSGTTNMKSMFRNCANLKSIDVSGWNVSNVTTMASMFSECSKLVSVNVSEWNVGKVINMNYAFYGCELLTSLDVSKWNVSSVTEMYAMFYDCSTLSAINVSKWEVDNVTTMRGMFAGCAALQDLDVSNWNVINLKEAYQLFHSCAALTTLNMKSWNTSSLTNTGGMFAYCSSLATIYVDTGWNMDSVTTSDDMFTDCTNLVGGAGTTYDPAHIDVSYAHVDGGVENPGYLTYKPAESTTPEQN